MRARLFGSLVAGVALASAVVMAGNASAAPATWTVTPGGPFTGTAGETILTTESGIELFCESSTATGEAASGTVENPLATLPEGGVTFSDCQGPFGLTFEVAHIGTWELNGVSYDGSDVTTGTLDNITAQISGPACEATVTGSVNGTYTNSTATLSILPEQTLTVSSVDPANDCLGLITQGEAAGFSGDYSISPALTVTSP